MFTITIDTGYPAFAGDNAGTELATILRDVAGRLDRGCLEDAATWQMHFNDSDGVEVAEAQFDYDRRCQP